ncbi:MAG: lipopolysaccharide biosynthesis protein [Hahellaceae bacterium]|nr:lipopolysaccharide biosynthesis protein [Hahellaceae bacterium]
MDKHFKRKALSGVFWTLLQKAGAQGSTLVVFIVLARILDATDFGHMAMAFVIVQFLGLFTAQGLTSSIIQKANIDEDHLHSAFWLNLAMGLLAMLVSWSTSGLLANLYGEPIVEDLINVLTITIFLASVTNVQVSILQREMDFKKVALRRLLADPIGGVVGIILAIYGWGVWALVARQLVTSLLQTLTVWTVITWRPQLRCSLAHVRDIIGYGANVLGVHILYFAGKQLDNFLIGLLMGAATLGEYNIAKRLVTLMMELIKGGIGNVTWSAFSRLQTNKAQLAEGFIQANRLVSIAVFPLFIFIGVNAEPIIATLFGAKWVTITPIAQALALLGLVEAVRSQHESLILAVGSSGHRLKLALLIAIANLVAFFAFYTFGMMWVCLGYAVLALLLFPLWVKPVLSATSLGLKRYLSTYKEAVAASFLLAATSLGVNYAIGDQWATLLTLTINGIVSLSIYSTTLYLLNPQILRSLTRRKSRNRVDS